MGRALGDTATDAVKPAGAAPVGDGGPFVGPYVAAANNDAHVAPGWAPTNTTVTFSTLYRKTTGGTVQHVRVTLPVGYTNISVAASAFSSGRGATSSSTRSTRTIDVQLTAGTGLATNNVDWARIDVTATTPLVNQSGNAADWDMQTFTNAAGSGAAHQNDNPPVLIGDITNPSATITLRRCRRQRRSRRPSSQNGIAATLRVRDHVSRADGDQVHRYRRPDLLQHSDQRDGDRQRRGQRLRHADPGHGRLHPAARRLRSRPTAS